MPSRITVRTKSTTVLKRSTACCTDKAGIKGCCSIGAKAISCILLSILHLLCCKFYIVLSMQQALYEKLPQIQSLNFHQALLQIQVEQGSDWSSSFHSRFV